MSLCDTRKAMKMGATNVEKRSLKTKHLAPIFRAVVMSLCDTRKAMKMGATNVEKRSLKTKHLAPIFRAELITERLKNNGHQPAESSPMAALVLDFRDERHHLPGPGEHFHQWRGCRRRVPFQQRPAWRGAQRLFVGLRDVPGPRRGTGGPFRAEASAYGWRSVVGSLHCAHRLDSRRNF